MSKPIKMVVGLDPKTNLIIIGFETPLPGLTLTTEAAQSLIAQLQAMIAKAKGTE
jgi:hypothetical protein